MKFLIILFATLAVASCAAKGGLRIRFDVGLGIGKKFFYNIPRSEQEALNEGWKQVPRPEGPLPSLKLYCLEDRVVGIFFDDTGYIAGVQVALDKDKYTDSVLDWETQGFTSWLPDNNGKEYWTIQQYFVNEEYLARDQTERLIARNADKTLQLGGVWVTGIDKQLVQIAGTQEGIDNSAFTKQACLPGMGRHYFYNMSATTECNSRGLLPWFSLVNDGELIGTGVITYGKMNLAKTDKNWFENPNKVAAKIIAPRGPECLYELADNPGLVTMHVYYVDQPWTITCLNAW